MRKGNHCFIVKSISVLIFCTFACALSADAASPPLYQKIDEVKIDVSKLDTGWLLDQEIKGNDQALDKFQYIYQKRAGEIVNQIFIYQKKVLQINYCLFDNEKDAELVELKMRSIVNELNTVFQRKNVVIEILSEDNFLKQEAMILLGGAPMLKDSLLGQSQIPDNWSLSQIILISKSKLPFFSNKLGGRVANIINQVFKAGNEILKINYVIGENAKESENIMIVMSKNTSTETRIIKKNQTVIEVITGNPALMAKAEELIK